MEGYFMFQWGRFVFQMGGRGASFLSGGHPMGGINFREGGGSKKIVRWGHAPHPPPPHYGKPCVLILNFCFACSLLLCMFPACMFCFTNITNV